MDESNNLLACPFCNAAAEYGESEDGGHFIQCTGRMCMASSKLIYPEKTDPRPLLTEVWNERAGAPVLRATDGSRLGAVSWLDALTKMVASAKALSVALYEVDEDDLACDAGILEDNLEELRRHAESASNVAHEPPPEQ